MIGRNFHTTGMSLPSISSENTDKIPGAPASPAEVAEPPLKKGRKDQRDQKEVGVCLPFFCHDLRHFIFGFSHDRTKSGSCRDRASSRGERGETGISPGKPEK